MRNLILSALLLASAFQTAMGEQDGEWFYTVSRNQATIIGYIGVGGAVTIPSSLNGYPVVRLASGIGANILANPSFPKDNTSVTSITIPNSVTSIGEYAFTSCLALTSVTIPNSVTSIGSAAFYNCTSLASVTIPNSVTSIGSNALANCTSLTSINIPNSVTSIGSDALANCTALTSFTIPDRFLSQVGNFGLSGQLATDYLINALANNDAFVSAVANKIKGTMGNYGIATQGLLFNVTDTLATKTEITTAINEGKASGIARVTASPNTWSLFTTSQIQNMAVGDLVLTKNVGGTFTLNYDIEQSTDLQTWTTYAPLSLPLTGLPTDKAFVRIRAKSGVNPASEGAAMTPVTDGGTRPSDIPVP